MMPFKTKPELGLGVRGCEGPLVLFSGQGAIFMHPWARLGEPGHILESGVQVFCTPGTFWGQGCKFFAPLGTPGLGGVS